MCSEWGGRGEGKEQTLLRETNNMYIDKIVVIPSGGSSLSFGYVLRMFCVSKS